MVLLSLSFTLSLFLCGVHAQWSPNTTVCTPPHFATYVVATTFTHSSGILSPSLSLSFLFFSFLIVWLGSSDYSEFNYNWYHDVDQQAELLEGFVVDGAAYNTLTLYEQVFLLFSFFLSLSIYVFLYWFLSLSILFIYSFIYLKIKRECNTSGTQVFAR